MKLKSRCTLIWIFVFICMFSSLLSTFFFVQIWLPSENLVNTFQHSKCLVTNITVYTKRQEEPCHPLNEDLWWYGTFDKLFEKNVVAKGSDTNTGDDWDYPTTPPECYCGIVSVNFTTTESTKVESQITGLWSANVNFVKGYLSQWNISQVIDCYYSIDTNTQVLPFSPISKQIGYILGLFFASLFGVGLIGIFITSIVKCAKKNPPTNIKLFDGFDHHTRNQGSSNSITESTHLLQKHRQNRNTKYGSINSINPICPIDTNIDTDDNPKQNNEIITNTNSNNHLNSNNENNNNNNNNISITNNFDILKLLMPSFNINNINQDNNNNNDNSNSNGNTNHDIVQTDRDYPTPTNINNEDNNAILTTDNNYNDDVNI